MGEEVLSRYFYEQEQKHPEVLNEFFLMLKEMYGIYSITIYLISQ